MSAANPQRAIQEVNFKKNIQDFWATVKSPTPEGGTFTLPKMANAEMNTVGAFTNDSQSLGGSAPTINTASMRSIPKDGENVKPKTLGDKIRRQIMGEEAESLPNGFGYKAERPKGYRSDDTIPDVNGNWRGRCWITRIFCIVDPYKKEPIVGSDFSGSNCRRALPSMILLAE